MALSELIRKFGDTFVRELEKNLPPEKDASGKLRGSIRVQFKFFTDTYSAEVYMADYWKWVDKGRKPGKMPPFDDIARWVNTKRTLAIDKSKRIVKKGNRLSDLKASRKNSIIYLIRRKIAKKGIEPTNFFTDTLKKGFVTDFKKAVATEYKKDIIVQIKSWQ